jgi:hypothetical protein
MLILISDRLTLSKIVDKFLSFLMIKMMAIIIIWVGIVIT